MIKVARNWMKENKIPKDLSNHALLYLKTVLISRPVYESDGVSRRHHFPPPTPSLLPPLLSSHPFPPLTPPSPRQDTPYTQSGVDFQAGEGGKLRPIRGAVYMYWVGAGRGVRYALYAECYATYAEWRMFTG